MTRIQAVLGRLNRRRDADERGFSLIELIIVIVILGILVAIAIPVYNNIQDRAKTNAAKTAAANGASQVAAKIADGATTVAELGLDKLSKDGFTVTLTKPASDALSLDNYCVQASGDATATAGPGC